MRKITRFHPMLLLIVMLGGLGVGIEARAQNDTSPTPKAPSTLAMLVDGNTQFTFDLYHRLGDEADNIIYSPYSISTALALVYAGARTETERQIADTLHFNLPQDDLHRTFAALSDRVTSIESEYEESFQLTIANAVWAQDGYPVLADYAALLNDHYGAGLQTVDFANATEAARVTINDWVSEQTAGRIPDMLAPASLSPLSRLVLTNAIYFNATWRFLFDEALTKNQSFTLLDGTAVQVPMMHRSGQFGYVAGDNYQVIELNYRPNAIVSMMIVLPDSGAFEAVEATFDADWFRGTSEALNQSVWNANLGMPRFGTEMAVELSEILAAMGMPDAFETSADFSGIADPAATGEPLFIGFVLHKAFIEVDEQGTEAAAATALGLGGGGPPNEPIDFEINRPFFYTIYHRQSDTILFVGRVLNPLEK